MCGFHFCNRDFTSFGFFILFFVFTGNKNSSQKKLHALSDAQKDFLDGKKLCTLI